MAEQEKPLSALVAQGWEVVTYSVVYDATEGQAHSFLLRKQKQHRILQIRTKWIGKGVVAKEIDV